MRPAEARGWMDEFGCDLHHALIHTHALIASKEYIDLLKLHQYYI
jgi:hypothetical protein